MPEIGVTRVAGQGAICGGGSMSWLRNETEKAGMYNEQGGHTFGHSGREVRTVESDYREEGRLERLRRLIVAQYAYHPTGCGNSFGEILCWEIHSNGRTFAWLAEKWGISLPTLGELIYDHCKRLEADPKVRHERDVKVD